MSEQSGIRALKPLFRFYPWGIPVVVLLGILSSLAEGVGIGLFIPLLQHVTEPHTASDPGSGILHELGRLFESVPPDERLQVIALCIFGAIVVKVALSYGSAVLFTWLDTHIGHRLRSEIFNQLLTVSYGYLERRDAGELLNTLGTETWRTSEALNVLVTLVITACTTVVYVVLLVLISWKMTLLVATAMLVISGIVRLLTRRVQQLGVRSTRSNARLSDRRLEGLAGMKLIRTFARERYEQRRFDVASQQVSDVFLKLGMVSGTVNPVYEVLASALLVGLLLIMLQSPGNLPSLLVFLFVL